MRILSRLSAVCVHASFYFVLWRNVFHESDTLKPSWFVITASWCHRGGGGATSHYHGSRACNCSSTVTIPFIGCLASGDGGEARGFTPRPSCWLLHCAWSAT